jgi:hypothetical protein
MADIERRRELLERLVAGLHAWILGEQAVDVQALWHVLDMATGALEIGDLGDDEAWLALLEMILEEVVDDDSNE